MDELHEIMNEFVDEATEVLNSVMVDLMDLERSYNDETVHRVYRAFHSVKGNSGMLGLERLSGLSHKAEDVLSLVREHRLQPDHEVASLLLQAVDAMTAVLEDVRCGMGDGRDVGQIWHQLDCMVQRHGGPKATKRPPAVVECTMRKQDKASIDDGSSATMITDESLCAQSVTPAPKATKATATATAVSRFDGPRAQGVSQPIRSRTAPAPTPQEVFGSQMRVNSNAGLRILVVEDDFSARQILVDFLGQFGACHVAKDGLEAIHAFIRGHEVGEPYDLICMDIKMPVMDGLTAARTMREIERGKGVIGADSETLIVITSSVEDPVAIIKACYECGANYYFLKPLDMAQVRRQLFKMGLAALMDGE